MPYHLVFQYRILFVAPLIFHQCTGSRFYRNRNRAINTYNTQTDPCFKLTPQSGPEAKELADLSCAWAFDALDQLEGNECSGWRRPECRQLNLPDFVYFQCSCSISFCNELGIRNDTIRPFRDCAWRLYTEVIFNRGQRLAPTANFQRMQQLIYDQAVQKARSRRQEASTSAGQAPVVPAPAPSPGSHGCDVCGLRFCSQSNLNDHKKHHDSGTWCHFCNMSFSSKSNFNQHVNNFHPRKPGSESDPSRCAAYPLSFEHVPRGPHICDICGKGYQRSNSLTAHKRAHLDGASCTICNEFFSNKTNYKRHMEQQHPEIARAEAAYAEAQRKLKKPHVCGKCGARYSAEKRLEEHMAVHRGETYCDECDITFPRKTLLNVHKRKVHPRKLV